MANVTLAGRTLYKDGAWNSLCLPFSMTQEQVTAQLAPSELKELDVIGKYTEAGVLDDTNGTYQTKLADDGTLYLYFKDTDEIIAGVPYIIKWVGDGTQNIENPTFMGVTINNVSLVDKAVSFQGGKFVGTYSYTQYNGEDKSILLLGGGNTLYWPQPGTDPNTGETVNPSIGAFRAYFQLDNPDAVRAFRLNFGNGEVQGITVTDYTDSADKSGAWYTINGMKLDKQPTRKGLYIKNGRKVVMK